MSPEEHAEALRTIEEREAEIVKKGAELARDCGQETIFKPAPLK